MWAIAIAPEEGLHVRRPRPPGNYGFQVDNGHFLFAEVGGDFRLATRVRFEPANQYDQAGLMVRMSERAGADYLVESSTDGADWSQLRLAHLHVADGQQPVTAGLYACSPKAAGFVAEFAYLTLSY